jgi:cbb3-type cytochrome oxidase subunit 3
MPMDASTMLTAIATLLLALAAVGEVAFKFWREKRKESKKRPHK